MPRAKFRVWDKRTNQMHPVAAISFGDDGSAQTIMVEIAPKGEHYNAIVDGESGSLMQFTGLLDKNGKEIYEGDVVRFEDYDNGVVTYLNASFVAEFSSGNKMGLHATMPEWMEVIGNVYELPELIVEVPHGQH